MTQALRFAETLTRLSGSASRLHGHIGDDWAQARTIYGGMSAAMTCEGIMRQLAAETRVRALQINFIGPVEPGTVEVTTEVLRRGKNVGQWAARLTQDQGIGCVATVTTAQSRESAISVEAVPLPVCPPPDQCRPLRVSNDTPLHFLKKIDSRYHLGHFPFTGSRETRVSGWCRFPNEHDMKGVTGILGILDAWPSPLLQQLNSFCFSSSVTWYVELLAYLPDAAGSDWWYYDSQAEYSRDGYTHFHAKLWHETGSLVAITRQVVATYG